MEDNIIINAVWGLGPYAVEGILTPDSYTVAKDADFTLLEAKITPKPVQLVNSPEGGVEEIPVAKDCQDQGRSPLSAVKLQLSVIRDGVAGELNDKQQHLIARWRRGQDCRPTPRPLPGSPGERPGRRHCA
jgi:hypothetical protein